MTRRPLASPLRTSLVALTCAGILLACGSSSKRSASFDDENGGAVLGNTPGGSGDPNFGGAQGAPGDGSNQGASCASQSTKAELKQLDIYIMLDQSSSMSERAGPTNKWDAVTSALAAFVKQPSLVGVGVGIQFFGLPPGGDAIVCPGTCKVDADCGVNNRCIPANWFHDAYCTKPVDGNVSCAAVDYASPEVPIAALPGVAAEIIRTIGRHCPSTSTPTLPALEGAVQHGKAWAAAHPDRVTIVLLATDGVPDSRCNNDLGTINAVATAGVSGTPKVLTFVIGVGDELQALNGIAKAGGTSNAYLVDVKANTQQQFLDALNKVRGAALGCQYKIPAAKAGGGELDFGKVNVEYTPGVGAKVTLPKVLDKSKCPATGDAWYYNNNSAPTEIELCDASCKAISLDLKGEVSVAVGCATVVR